MEWSLKLSFRHDKWHGSDGIKLGRLRPPKRDKKDDPQIWATPFPHLTLQKKKSEILRQWLRTKDPPQLNKNNQLHALCFQTKNKPKVRQGLASTCTLCSCYEEYNKPMVFHISRQKSFPVEWKPDMCTKYGIYVAICVICNQQHVGQTVSKFFTSWSTHRATWNKPDKRDGSDQIALSRRYTVFKCYKLNAQIKIQWMTLSGVKKIRPFTLYQGCGVGSPVIRLRLRAISIIRLRLQLRLRADSDLQLY